VIVSCPRCHKQYRLDVSRLNYARLPDNSGLGVQLACSNCHEQWWELKKESVNTNQAEYRAAVPEQPFRNLTDISLLYQRQASNYAYQNTAPAQNFSIAASAENQMFAPSTQPIKSEPFKPVKWKKMVKIALWSVIIVGGAITFMIAAMKFGQTTSLLPVTNESAQAPVEPGEVIIEDIQFNVKPIDENLQWVIVIGNVKNPGPLAIPLHDTQITVWGGCAEGQTPNDQGLCEIKTWSYKWKQDLLQSGEQLTFKGRAKIPANLQVDQVHVDVASN
jgi:hypothetical protein